tara:strand:- start:3981 stop:4364 length:384 start_codon:yes stop_codon:yes gene_type:complete
MKKHLIILFVIPLIGCYTKTQPTQVYLDVPIDSKKKVIDYHCDNNKEISVSYTSINKKNTQKDIAIINSQGNQPIILAAKQVASGFLYTNGKYTLRGKGNDVQWTIGRMMPIKCTVVNNQSKQKALI